MSQALRGIKTKSKKTGASAARRRMSPEERRAQLLACAIEVFATRGIRRAGHGDVAKVAGCAVSTVFLYFPTREELVDAVLDEIEAFYASIARTVHSDENDAQAVLLAHSRQFRESIDSHPEHALVLLNWAANVRSRVWPRYMEMMESSVRTHRRTIERGIAEGTIDDGVDAESAARVIIGYANMSIQLRLAEFEDDRADQVSRRMINALLSPTLNETAA